ncbi:MAG: hypothetical protein ACI3ZB_01275 [Prevotella sp.]
MKKTYYTPAIKVMAVDCTDLMAATTEPTLGLNEREQSVYSDEMFSKRGNGSLWQNEAEE